jgi:multidrug efflux pump subunit AcrA (membrane-fusion protein)
MAEPTRLLAGLLAAALVLPACRDRAAPPPADHAPADAAPPAHVEGEPEAEVVGARYVAVIAAERSVDLAPKLPGELVKVGVRVGDAVDEGAIIATLDNRAAREALGMARAELASAQASRRQTDVEVAEASRQLELERQLVAQGTRPKRAEEDARFAREKALAARNRASASVSEARARLKRLERQLGETSIRAPLSPCSTATPARWSARRSRSCA